MQPFTTVSPRVVRQSRIVHCTIVSKRSALRRFHRFIESTDWDERYLNNKWIDKICLGGIVISLLYFVPVMAPIFLK
jgi:hypothetical protein